MKTMNVLIVDDDPIARVVLEGELRQLGHVVTACADVESAWAVFRSGNHRVIVSDWMMPGVDGLEFCRRVRAEGGDYVYFILLTHRESTNENQDLAIEAGVDDFLSKPVDHHELNLRLRVAGRIIEFSHQVQKLEAFLPICGYCKKIRDDQNYWKQLEQYINERTGSKFSHGICPDCMDTKLKPELRRLGIELPGEGAAGDEAKRPPPSARRV
ncbi:MAG: response regulator [Opitutaceae bacterium]|jgi:DNA-binding response OmpR family regulator|nr:response regulator [Opitutaceae bacterium]